MSATTDPASFTETPARPPYRLIEGYQSVWPAPTAGRPIPKRPKFGFLRELPALIIVALVLAVTMKTFLVQAFFIPSESMEPTLHGCNGCSGDRIIVNKLAYHFREPRRGEIIVFVAKHVNEDKSFFGRIKHVFGEAVGFFKPESIDYVKRIIGLPGDVIRVDETGVTITPPRGRPTHLTEPYILSQDQQGPSFGTEKRFVVPAGRFFVMGDNRANSADSRFQLGPIKREDIIGKAFVRVWPPTRWGVLHSPTYGKLSLTATAAPAGRALPSGPGRTVPWPMLAVVALARRRE